MMPSPATALNPPNLAIPEFRTHDPDAKPQYEQLPDSNQTGSGLVGMLRTTGTGPSRVAKIQKWMDAQDSEPSAKDTLEWMIAEQFPLGTVRKAGKWLYGMTWDIRPHGVTASDEVASLREETARLKVTLGTMEAKNVILMRENQTLRTSLAPQKAVEQLERIRGSAPLPETSEEQEPELASVGEEPKVRR